MCSPFVARVKQSSIKAEELVWPFQSLAKVAGIEQKLPEKRDENCTLYSIRFFSLLINL